MISRGVDANFWQGKTVFLTGHTGFKGSWLSLWLSSLGAKVCGYALAPSTTPNLFTVLNLQDSLKYSQIADIRDLDALQKAVIKAQPDIVIHMAAQPLVRYSYTHPVETYATNVMGTLNLLESLRSIDSARATVVVTTDKCYENNERLAGYQEHEPMGGHDPYSNSKGCAELVTAAYRRSFFSADQYLEHHNAIASARAGNVIGGGDWSEDRLIPDAIKAFEANKPLIIRNTLATRPWQHVLEPLSGYLVLAQALYEEGTAFAQGWNFGPKDSDARPVQEVVELLISAWGSPASWVHDGSEHPHEAKSLKLNITKARENLGWVPKWTLETAIEKIAHWQKAYQNKRDMKSISLNQIREYSQS
ncbi:CDP-glucose 4,6-dehydratase [Polynucleobacter sp. es-MAR-4]|nr:CDP-glucose 4,6-dehydratase [Polynucleobacter sp. es-MAR-4]